MDTGGLKIAALYSFYCKKAIKCGINDLLLEFIQTGKRQNEVILALQKLISFNWYEIIASLNNIESPFTEKVVKSYWTGNELTAVMPKGDGFLFPFHNFTIFKHDDKRSRNIKDINDCKISVGRIVESRGDKLLVAQRPIIWEFGKFLLGGFSEIETEKGFVDEVKKGNWMSSHYGIGRQILSKEEADCLIKKTEEAIDLFNKNSI